MPDPARLFMVALLLLAAPAQQLLAAAVAMPDSYSAEVSRGVR